MNIDEINDHFEIERLMIKYVEAIDNKDWNMLDEVFTEQAFLDYESSGGPEGKGDYPTIKKWLQKNLSMFPMTQHMIGKSFIEYHGDSANAELCSITLLEFRSTLTVFMTLRRKSPRFYRWRMVQRFLCQNRRRLAYRKIEEQAYMQGSFPPLQ